MPDETNVGGEPVADQQDVSELVEKLASAVEGVQSEISGLYSRQDKDRNTAQQTQDLLRELTESVKGLTTKKVPLDEAVELAQQRLVTKERDRIKNEQTDVAPDDPPEDGASRLKKEVLASMELPLDDPRVVALMNSDGDIAQITAKAAQLKVELSKVPPAPTGAEIPQSGGGSAVVTGAYDEAAYMKDMSGIMTNTKPGSEERYRAIAQLKEDARKKGLDKN